MRVVLQFGVGDPTEFAPLASTIAADANAKGDANKAKTYWEVEAEWQKRTKDTAAEQKARISAAEAAVTEAEKRARGKGASFLAAAFLLAKAIEELRQAGATNERLTELRKLLNEWQERSMSEFQTFSTGIDISQLVDRARGSVRAEDFPAAALNLALGQDLSNPKKIKDEVVENAKRAPMTY